MRPSRDPTCEACGAWSEWWTAADGAELDVLVFDLAGGYIEHRERCVACQDRCPIVAAYLEHRESCWHCKNSIKVPTEIYREPCARYLAFLVHGPTCPRCNPCLALRTAIEAVVAWRDARELRSKAAWLRRQEFERERTPGRVHIAFDERGEVVEYEIAAAEPAAPQELAGVAATSGRSRWTRGY